jgi:hypothetical protein
MFLFYVLRFFKKGDTIEGGTLFKKIVRYLISSWYLSTYKGVSEGGAGGQLPPTFRKPLTPLNVHFNFDILQSTSTIKHYAKCFKFDVFYSWMILAILVLFKTYPCSQLAFFLHILIYDSSISTIDFY